MNLVTALRSLLHVGILASVIAWGLVAWPFPLPAVIIAGVVALVFVLLWALFLSPKPVLAADRFGRSVVEVVLIAGAVAALLSIGVVWGVPVFFGLAAVALAFIDASSR